jgi:hypothetical protein
MTDRQSNKKGSGGDGIVDVAEMLQSAKSKPRPQPKLPADKVIDPSGNAVTLGEE